MPDIEHYSISNTRPYSRTFEMLFELDFCQQVQEFLRLEYLVVKRNVLQLKFSYLYIEEALLMPRVEQSGRSFRFNLDTKK